MDVYWLEQAEADVPSDDGWLTPSEAARLNGMRFAKRRAEWRLGRWTAKRALAILLGAADDRGLLSSIEIRTADSGAPEVFMEERRTAIPISLSHRAGRAICAIASPGAALGCDLEVIEERSYAFVADYFTVKEQTLIARVPATDRFQMVALLWSGKESALKALGEGLRLDTRSVTIDPIRSLPPPDDRNAWRPLEACCPQRRIFLGWWQQTGNFLRTVVSAPRPEPPVLLGPHIGPCWSILALVNYQQNGPA